MKNEIPRRNRLDLCTPAELAIVNSVQEIEKMPPDVRLTNAVNLLHQARELVADCIDNRPSPSVSGEEKKSLNSIMDDNVTMFNGKIPMWDKHAVNKCCREWEAQLKSHPTGAWPTKSEIYQAAPYSGVNDLTGNSYGDEAHGGFFKGVEWIKQWLRSRVTKTNKE